MTTTTAEVFAHDHALLDLAGVGSLPEALARWTRALGEVAAGESDPVAARLLCAVSADVEHLLARFAPSQDQCAGVCGVGR